MAFDRSQLTRVSNVAAATADAPVVLPIPGKRVRVLAVAITTTVTPAATVQFNSKPTGAGSAISPLFGLAADTTIVLPDGNWFQTNVGEGLTVTTGAGTTGIGVIVTYAVITP